MGAVNQETTENLIYFRICFMRDIYWLVLQDFWYNAMFLLPLNQAIAEIAESEYCTENWKNILLFIYTPINCKWT